MSVLASAGVWLLTSTSTPTPPVKAPDPDSVTPGVLGFLVVFVLAVATWLLMRNLTARLRRMAARGGREAKALCGEHRALEPDSLRRGPRPRPPACR